MQDSRGDKIALAAQSEYSSCRKEKEMILVSKRLKEGARLIVGCVKDGNEFVCTDCYTKAICDHRGLKIETREQDVIPKNKESDA